VVAGGRGRTTEMLMLKRQRCHMRTSSACPETPISPISPIAPPFPIRLRGRASFRKAIHAPISFLEYSKTPSIEFDSFNQIAIAFD